MRAIEVTPVSTVPVSQRQLIARKTGVCDLSSFWPMTSGGSSPRSIVPAAAPYMITPSRAGPLTIVRFSPLGGLSTRCQNPGATLPARGIKVKRMGGVSRGLQKARGMGR